METMRAKEILDEIGKEIYNKVKESGIQTVEKIKEVAETCLIDALPKGEKELSIDDIFETFEVVRDENKDGGYTFKFTLKDNEYGFTMAVCVDGLNLKRIPADKVTKDICLRAVEQNYTALRYVPRDFRSASIIKTAINGFLTDMSVFESDYENSKYKLNVKELNNNKLLKMAQIIETSLPVVLEICKNEGLTVLEVGESYDKSYRDVEPSCTGKYAVVGFYNIGEVINFKFKGEDISAVVGKDGSPYVKTEKFKIRKQKERKPKEKSPWNKHLKKIEGNHYSYLCKMPFSYKLFMRISGEYKRVKDLHAYDLLNYAHEMRIEGRSEKAGLFISDLKTLNDTCSQESVFLVKMDRFEPSWIVVQKHMMGFTANGYTYQIGHIFSAKTEEEDNLIKLKGIVSYEK